MAAFETTRVHHASAGFAGRIGQFLVEIVKSVADWNDTRMTRAALNKLTDRELTDIGLSRGDIAHIE